eukprot:scaffold625_cov324-Pavlova_lutheri.AAC.42
MALPTSLIPLRLAVLEIHVAIAISLFSTCVDALCPAQAFASGEKKLSPGKADAPTTGTDT